MAKQIAVTLFAVLLPPALVIWAAWSIPGEYLGWFAKLAGITVATFLFGGLWREAAAHLSHVSGADAISEKQLEEYLKIVERTTK